MSLRTIGFASIGFALWGSACGGGLPPPEACQHLPEAYPDLPRLVGMSPASGPPGSTVILSGTGFDQLDARYAVAYGDFSQSCVHATLEGGVRSASELEVVIPEDATLSGYLYLLVDGRVVSRAPNPFQLVRNVATVVVQNRSQFPIVSVDYAWMPVLEAGDQVGVEDTATFEVEPGPFHLELCAGAPADSGGAETFACQVFEGGRLSPNQVFPVDMAPVRAAHVLVGEWVGSWMVGEEAFEERITVSADGFWELRYDGRVVESGTVVEPSIWPAYRTTFEFGLRVEDPPSQAELPLRTFSMHSPRAGDRIAFYRPE